MKLQSPKFDQISCAHAGSHILRENTISSVKQFIALIFGA